jgi:competence protein ComEA
MPRLNRSERRALRLAALLVVMGTAARLGLGPGQDAHGWRAVGAPAGSDSALAAFRGAVEENVDRARRAATPLAPGERLDPNRAPLVELERLPGVGPATARAIAEHRERRGFRWRDDLRAVRGIGPATLARMAPHLALPERPPAAGRAGRPRGEDVDAAPRRGPAPPGRLELNAATHRELEALPGVGPVLAAEIVAWRSRNGGFEEVEQLLEVRGIGPARLGRLRPLVEVR